MIWLPDVEFVYVSHWGLECGVKGTDVVPTTVVTVATVYDTVDMSLLVAEITERINSVMLLLVEIIPLIVCECPIIEVNIGGKVGQVYGW